MFQGLTFLSPIPLPPSLYCVLTGDVVTVCVTTPPVFFSLEKTRVDQKLWFRLLRDTSKMRFGRCHVCLLKNLRRSLNCADQFLDGIEIATTPGTVNPLNQGGLVISNDIGMG